MAFQQALSGLNSASKSLDVISNNVSNSGNVGFKMSNTQFSDLFAASLTGAIPGMQVGIGTQVGRVSQAFSQGNITATNNPLDVAINGTGFFRMSQDGGVAFTRNGQFEIDKNGYVINAQGYRLTGYQADATGNILPGAPSELVINSADIPPKGTSTLTMALNLDSSSTVPATTPFNAASAGSYNYSTSATLYDSLGDAHILTMYFAKSGSNNWNMYTALDGDTQTSAGSPTATALAFNTAGTLATPMPITFASLTSAALTAGGAAPMTGVNLNLTNSSQYGTDFSVSSQTQDGFASGKLSGITIGDDGIVQGRYSNAQTRSLGQVVLANFADPQGLISLGSNLWSESPASGVPLVGTPKAGNLGTLTSGAVEDSNVDLTAELVNMITAQRNYQANAQSIKTQDQILQTLVNLR